MPPVATMRRDTARVHIDIPETLPTVAADPALLERAIANLVDNALKWSPDDRPIYVQADVCDDRIDLRIVDQGPGIAGRPAPLGVPNFRTRRRQRTSAPADGAALGLAVAKGFIKAMHGELTLDDTPGGGLTATISFPHAVNARVTSYEAKASSDLRGHNEIA